MTDNIEEVSTFISIPHSIVVSDISPYHTQHFRLAQHQAVLEKEKQEVWGDVLSSAKAVSQVCFDGLRRRTVQLTASYKLLVSVDEVRKRRGMDRHPSSQYHEDFHSPCLNRVSSSSSADYYSRREIIN